MKSHIFAFSLCELNKRSVSICVIRVPQNHGIFWYPPPKQGEEGVSFLSLLRSRGRK